MSAAKDLAMSFGAWMRQTEVQMKMIESLASQLVDIAKKTDDIKQMLEELNGRQGKKD